MTSTKPWFPRGPAGSTPGADSCHDACLAGSQAWPDPRDPSPRSPPLLGARDPRPDPTPPTLQCTSPVPANLSAGGNELSFNCLFAFSASCLVISSFLINLFGILAFSFDLIVLSI